MSDLHGILLLPLARCLHLGKTLSSPLSYSVHDQADLVQAGGSMDKEIPCMLSTVASIGLTLGKSLIFKKIYLLIMVLQLSHFKSLIKKISFTVDIQFYVSFSCTT